MIAAEAEKLRRMAAPPKCAFCSEGRDLMCCDWPTLRFVPTTYGKLSVGDRVRRIVDKAQRPPAVVVGLIGLELPQMQTRLSLVTVVLRKANGKEIMRELYARSPVRVELQFPCDVWCCPLHRAERGLEYGSRVHCADHWRAWEQVA